jgi:hypothetical protein
LEGEVERRRRAVEQAEAGWSKTAIAAELGRSREWVHKWLKRFEADGYDGLESRSQVPHTSPTRLAVRVIDQIVAVREELEDDRFANSGAKAVMAEIERRGLVRPVPSESSIQRALADRAMTRPHQKPRRAKGPVLGLPKVTTPGVWQQADWVQERFLEGGIRFSSLQIADVGSHMISADQHLDRRLLTAVRQLTEDAWPKMSIPYALGTDNAFSKTSHRTNMWTVWVKVLLMFGVEVVISPPNSLGFTNHIEAVNGLWQDRTINTHRYQSLQHLKDDNIGFVTYANTRRPILDPAICGTRYPAEYVASHADHLRWPPPGFTIDDYLDATDTPRIPLTRGRVTHLRHVTNDHTIEIAGTTWTVPPKVAIGGIVVATLDTATGRLTLRHKGDITTEHKYPITPSNIDPYHPTTQHGLLDQLSAIS